MRIVLDTNILISALITKGTPPDLLYQAWLRGEIELVTSLAQLSEMAQVLARPRLRRFVDADEAAAIVENIGARAVVQRELPVVDLSADPDDNPILATAIDGKADLLVTGDKKHLLALGVVEGIPVVTAREALSRVAKA
ncbi:MAG: putative toxin-antitoxin system toxin component, PIN family [Deltaproteobacteria bacterium]|nr:putative toxin-antitoxin system toxin component, PIN family [Deltaproteobacteria bacterium]